MIISAINLKLQGDIIDSENVPKSGQQNRYYNRRSIVIRLLIDGSDESNGEFCCIVLISGLGFIKVKKSNPTSTI